MLRRAAAFLVAFAVMGGAVSGAECYWLCPPAAAAPTDHCHEAPSTTTAAVSAHHDCADHLQVPSPITRGPRVDRSVARSGADAGALDPAALSHPPGPVDAITPAAARPRDVSPPVRFRTPLRQ